MYGSQFSQMWSHTHVHVDDNQDYYGMHYRLSVVPYKLGDPRDNSQGSVVIYSHYHGDVNHTCTVAVNLSFIYVQRSLHGVSDWGLSSAQR